MRSSQQSANQGNMEHLPAALTEQRTRRNDQRCWTVPTGSQRTRLAMSCLMRLAMLSEDKTRLWKVARLRAAQIQ